jgi:predicted DNA-binding transcriptional regulator YafY
VSTRPTPRPPPDAERVLAERVFAGGRSKPFAELTADEVKARAEELRAVTGWGPTAKVASVAMAWAELARLMEHVEAGTVGDLRPDAVAERAEKLWVVPPGGSLL